MTVKDQIQPTRSLVQNIHHMCLEERMSAFMGTEYNLTPPDLLAHLILRSSIAQEYNLNHPPVPSAEMIGDLRFTLGAVIHDFDDSEFNLDMLGIGITNSLHHQTLLASLTWVYPDRGSETQKKRLKRTHLQPAAFNLHEYDDSLLDFLAPDINRQLRSGEPVYIFSPVAVIAFPFICDLYGNKQQYPLEGIFTQTAVYWASWEKDTFHRNRIAIKHSLQTTRTWDPSTLAYVEMIQDQDRIYRQLALSELAHHLAHPLEGGAVESNL